MIHTSKQQRSVALVSFIAGMLVSIMLAGEVLQLQRYSTCDVTARMVGDEQGISSELLTRKLDFLEIGTSDFNTLIQAAAAAPDGDKAHGVSVDAMQIYLDRLPALPTCQKLNAAVVGYEPHPAELDVYYMDPDDIIKHNLPEWLRGCNRVGHPHQTTAKLLAEKNLPFLMQHRRVPVVSIAELLRQTKGCHIRKLKVDVEGLDPELIMGYVRFLWQNWQCYADEIVFEFNELSSEPAQHRALEALGFVGYRLQDTDGDDLIWVYHQDSDARR